MNAFLCAPLFCTASSIAETAHLKVRKLLNAASSWSMLTWHTHTYTEPCCIQVSPDQPWLKHGWTRRTSVYIMVMLFIQQQQLHGRRGVDTNAQTGILPKGVVPYAFRDLMIHGNLQFTLRIAVRCALHHCGCQGIRGLQLFFDFFSKI